MLSEPRSSLPLGVSACQLSIESESLNLLIILTADIGILFPGGYASSSTTAVAPRSCCGWTNWPPVPLPHFPLPAKIRIQVLEPIDLRTRFGDEPDWDHARDYVTSVMQGRGCPSWPVGPSSR
jgi:hypothetical protein